jgi:hypothetical protein
MSKKDYEVIAMAWRALLAACRGDSFARTEVLASIREIADSLERGNPRFNRSKFFAACGASNDAGSV